MEKKKENVSQFYDIKKTADILCQTNILLMGLMEGNEKSNFDIKQFRQERYKCLCN